MAPSHDQPSLQDWVRASARNPDDIETSEEFAMSDDQAHRLKALCWQRGERFDDSLTARQAEKRIAELEAQG